MANVGSLETIKQPGCLRGLERQVQVKEILEATFEKRNCSLAGIRLKKRQDDRFYKIEPPNCS